MYLATAVVALCPGFLPSRSTLLSVLSPLLCPDVLGPSVSASLPPDWRKGGEGREEGDDRQEKARGTTKGFRSDSLSCQKWLLSASCRDKCDVYSLKM